MRKRIDGYHDIESVFYPVGICDVLEVVRNTNKPDGIVSMYCSGIPIKGEIDKNLCMKVYKRIAKDITLPAADIYLHKIIPMGAGVGGGSADAAFLIRLLNDEFELGFDEEAMTGYAAETGSDCSFFIRNKPVFAEGRGEKLTEINFSLYGYKIWLIKPDIHINTAEAYSMIRPSVPPRNVKNIILNEPIEKWKESIANDFEAPVFALFPEIKRIKDFFYDSGAVYSSMTGSGSAVYGLFRELPAEKEHPFGNIFSWRGELK